MTVDQNAVIKTLNLSVYDITNFFGNSSEKTTALTAINEAIVLLTNQGKTTGVIK